MLLHAVADIVRRVIARRRARQAVDMRSTDESVSKPGKWRTWVEHPDRLWLRRAMFQLHFWVGAAVSAYVFLMSVTGSVIVFRDQLAPLISVEGIVRLHRDWLAGSGGSMVNAIGALALLVLSVSGAVIWWPGRLHWRRSLTINRRASFPRITWDLHSALGFWFLPFVAMWGLSGWYLAQPEAFEFLRRFDPSERRLETMLFALSELHFGRFNIASQIFWAFAGIVLAALAFSGMFICCRRVIWGRPSGPTPGP